MRTLDEVIEGYERCHGAYGTDESCEYCPLFDICEHDPQMASPWDDDMYHYLKEFQGLSKMWNDKLDKEQENPPLDWETLKQMEGKPVWVEYNLHIRNKDFRDKSKRWCIVREFKPWHDIEIIITENGFVLSKNEQIKCWQAYRKERS